MEDGIINVGELYDLVYKYNVTSLDATVFILEILVFYFKDYFENFPSSQILVWFGLI